MQGNKVGIEEEVKMIAAVKDGKMYEMREVVGKREEEWIRREVIGIMIVKESKEEYEEFITKD